MNPLDPTLGRITAIDSWQRGRVMNTWSIMRNSIALIVFQTGWLWTFYLGSFLARSIDIPSATAQPVCLVVSILLLLSQLCLIFLYPEWPINLWLCGRLRRAVLEREDHAGWVSRKQRVVELVPRDRWSQSLFETATDLLMIRVNDEGLWLEGDLHRYVLPAGSILSAELQPSRPPGWFTSVNMVVVYARTEDGPVELPIAYRDHSLGGLANSKRRIQAIELADQINRIARGSDPFREDTIDSSSDGMMHVSRGRESNNPYATPASLG